MQVKDLIAEQRILIDRTLGPIISGARNVALVDFPNHANVGDSAIWLGEKAWLESHESTSVRYVCECRNYSRVILVHRLPAGPILMHGGGSLGDLWERHQLLRERVIRDFPDRQIVQLPQTIHFKSVANLRRAKAVFDEHPNLTLLVRDRRSLDVARNEFRARTLLCPDMAFALGSLQAPTTPTKDIVWHSRQDLEAHEARPAEWLGQHPVDWLEDPPSWSQFVHRMLTPAMLTRRRSLAWLQTTILSSSDRLARERLARGCGLLGAGRTVVTNRLHGHILCLLLGIRHFVSDNNYGKIRDYFETWTRRTDLATWCETESKALQLARDAAR